MNEEAAAQDYLLNYLDADTTLKSLVNGVTLRSVPATWPFPVVKIDRLSADDLMVINLHRVWADLTFLVRGVVHWRGGGLPDWEEVRSIADRIDALLHDYEGSNSEIEVHSFREESFTDEQLQDNDVFLYCGGIYRLRARAL